MSDTGSVPAFNRDRVIFLLWQAYDSIPKGLVEALEVEYGSAYRAGVRAVLDRARAEAGTGGQVSVCGLANEFEDDNG